MHAELTELARNRACSDVVLVTGDGDLLPGLMSAKEHGVAVHLWAVQAADGDYNQSEDLVAEADERRVLDRAWITKAVRAKETGGVCAPPPVPRPEIAAILSAPLPEAALAASAERASEAQAAAARNGTGTGTAEPEAAPHPQPAPGHKGVPTPKDLASLRAPGAQAAQHTPQPPAPNATLRWSSDKGWVERGGRSANPPRPRPCRPWPSSPARNSAGRTGRRTSPPSAVTPSRSARSSPGAGWNGCRRPSTCRSCPPCTPASRTASTANC